MDVAKDLAEALGKRGATVVHDGKSGRPDIVITTPDFAVVVELAMRSGADAASEYLAIRAHRDVIEWETGKPTHLLFSCLRTPARIIRAIREENAARAATGKKGRVLFMDLPGLELALDRLRQTSAELYPIQRWAIWFDTWESMADDSTALEQLQHLVLTEDEPMQDTVRPMIARRMQVEQEALRRDVSALEDLLRHVNVTRTAAMHVLVYTMFVKLYEEKREGAGKENRFTLSGFIAYRDGLPAKARHDYEGRTLQHLIENDIALDPDVSAAGILAGVQLPKQINDDFVESELLPVLEKYRFRGTHLDALGAVFEALARRAEKDTRIGQFFTPEPIVRFAVDIALPGPLDCVLDPAAGTGRFLTLSMDKMVSRASEVTDAPTTQVIKKIHKERLLGADADPWIVTIAKMNMYIHGDGKSNIRHENGLFLADLPVFKKTATLLDSVDVCLTNPPLGEMSYSAYASDLLTRDDVEYSDASQWLHKRLPLLPGGYVEEHAIAEYEKKIDAWVVRERAAIVEGDARGEARARRYRQETEEKRAEALAKLKSSKGTYRVSGSTAKGGALFLAAIKDYLKPSREASAVEEWRGGKLGIIVDEAILNTPEYAETRRFIRRFYFVKAVFSFSRDAFWYQARTTAKTSLLYLLRKPDPTVAQREPVFFCHIEKIGFTKTGKPDESELPRILEAYKKFEAAIKASYKGPSFKEAVARKAVGTLDLPSRCRVQWEPSANEWGARMDYGYEAAQQLRAQLPSDHKPLGYYVENVVRHPPEDPLGIYSFATVDRNTGEVRMDRVADTKYEPKDLRAIGTGDIVISGIDLVHGSIGYAQADVAERVVSKEFYTLRVRPEFEEQVDARYIALLLRTPHARELVAGMVTGTSNRTRIEDVDSLLGLPLPPMPAIGVQRTLAGQVATALERRRKARVALNTATIRANKVWEGALTEDESEQVSSTASASE
ncbi:MAG TPA: N-6 DNA methylase [Gemmatimonadaceae bacterium]